MPASVQMAQINLEPSICLRCVKVEVRSYATESKHAYENKEKKQMLNACLLELMVPSKVTPNNLNYKLSNCRNCDNGVK